jgi:hypothetical protein
MCRKSFTFATFVRHSIPKLPENYYSFPTDIIEEQIAIGKGFSVYMPAIKCSFRVNKPQGGKNRPATAFRNLSSQMNS